jgi:hypothetical protein
MPVRWWSLVCLAFLGCHALQGPTQGPTGQTPLVGQATRAGQTFLSAEPPARPNSGNDAPAASAETVLLKKADSAPSPEKVRGPNHLTLAARALEAGHDEEACQHLRLFLETNPGHRNARFYHAELLLRLKRFQDAGGEFERAIADAQEDLVMDWRHVTHCHSRLVEIGEALDDPYLAHLHRGIGLFLLGEQRSTLEEMAEEMAAESLYCRALGELALARALQPSEARPAWYLFRVWRQLAQAHPARRALLLAQANAPFSSLTPAEQRGLELAGR